MATIIQLLMILFGVSVILLGKKGYTPQGIPWSAEKRLTGSRGKTVGLICILFGAGVVCLALAAMFFG